MEPRALPYDWKDVRRRLQGRMPDLLRRLGIDASITNGLCTPKNPRRDDRRAGSFVIWCEGEAAGAWRDYACEAAGDVFDLIAYLGGLARKIDVYWWALEFLGLGRGEVRSASQAELDRRRAEDERRAAAAKREAAEGEKSAALFRAWLQLPPIAGTLAERYLVEGRGIELARIRPPGALRYAQRLEHVDRETGEVTYWPAMVAAVTRGKKLTGLHRTWLRPDGLAKAEVAKPKMMLGACRGGAIRLSAGPSGLSPTEAARKNRTDPLAIGEGIETTLSVAVARPDYRCWAAGSLSLMGLVDWPACASAAVLLRDNDWDNPTAAKAFDAALAHWRGQAAGRPLAAAASAVGSDFNDWRAAS